MLAVCWLMTGSLWASALMLAAIAMVLLDMGGAMYLAGIQLNAVRTHIHPSFMHELVLQLSITGLVPVCRLHPGWQNMAGGLLTRLHLLASHTVGRPLAHRRVTQGWLLQTVCRCLHSCGH